MGRPAAGRCRPPFIFLLVADCDRTDVHAAASAAPSFRDLAAKIAVVAAETRIASAAAGDVAAIEAPTAFAAAVSPIIAAVTAIVSAPFVSTPFVSTPFVSASFVALRNFVALVRGVRPVGGLGRIGSRHPQQRRCNDGKASSDPEANEKPPARLFRRRCICRPACAKQHSECSPHGVLSYPASELIALTDRPPSTANYNIDAAGDPSIGRHVDAHETVQLKWPSGSNRPRLG